MILLFISSFISFFNSSFLLSITSFTFSLNKSISSFIFLLSCFNKLICLYNLSVYPCILLIICFNLLCSPASCKNLFSFNSNFSNIESLSVLDINFFSSSSSSFLSLIISIKSIFLDGISSNFWANSSYFENNSSTLRFVS